MDYKSDLKQLNKKPNKVMGQNFLQSDKIIEDIIGFADLKAGELVVEIGSGLGVLSMALTKAGAKVLAIEKDRDLAETLRRKNIPNLTVVTGDALDVDWTLELKNDYKIIANIPYSITSPLIRKIISLEKRPSLVVLMVQKELAERICAKPDNSDRGLLTIMVEATLDARILEQVGRDNFYPVPKVDSALIELKFKEKDLRNDIFWPLIEAAFSHKRQTIANAIATGLRRPKTGIEAILKSVNIDPMNRAEDLELADWLKLTKYFNGDIK